ncbi:MAG: hypothetical protein AW11_03794 [Candidatus Accumulibacter regalis]|uniref:Uncharacterized protein n=1 Tax=Accumulibacter regalis TaxID=522306 RepID=A0A011PAC9_ACCRE|nr:MAG: hypothetical protein AW11_03794 [Candidatus Accumulibacter regalis]
MGQPSCIVPPVGRQVGAQALAVVAMLGGKELQQAQVQGAVAVGGLQTSGGVEPDDVAQRAPRLTSAGCRRQGVCCRLRRRGRSWQPAQQRFVELIGAHRLGEVVVHSRVEAASPVLVESVGGDGNDRQQFPSGKPADRPACGEAVDYRHLHVHQHQRVVAAAGPCACGEPVDRLLTVADSVDLQPDRS